MPYANICMDGTVLLGGREINMHWLCSLKSALQDDTIFAGNDVIQRQMTSFDPPSWLYYLHLSISLFLKRSKETMEITQNKAGMFMKCTNLWVSTIRWGKKLCQKVDIWPKKHTWNFMFSTWQRQNWWTHEWHTTSAKNEETATESLKISAP